MSAGKEHEKHGNDKKPPNKRFSIASWEERTVDKEEEENGDITDPELNAEMEYAAEHGTEFNMNLNSGDGLAVENDRSKSSDKAKKDTLSGKSKQVKADRKACGRGVSGSMCKKDKEISCGGFHTLMDIDVYYGLEDEYGGCLSDIEGYFNSDEDDYELTASQEKEKVDHSKIDLIDDRMNQMSLNDDDKEEDDDRPGPSRSYGTGDHGKPKRFYRM